MQIQINTDRNIHGHDAYIAKVHDRIRDALERLSGTITRVEVHLSDQNGEKPGLQDKRCVIEVRLEHRRPVAVKHLAGTADEAVDGAVGKIVSVLEKLLDRKQDDARGRKASSPLTAETPDP